MVCMTFSLSFVYNICEKLWYEICSQIMNTVRYINIMSVQCMLYSRFIVVSPRTGSHDETSISANTSTKKRNFPFVQVTLMHILCLSCTYQYVCACALYAYFIGPTCNAVLLN